jgi:hypothetical protein
MSRILPLYALTPPTAYTTVAADDGYRQRVKGGAEMELLVLAGALVVLDVAAYFFGHDSREAMAPRRHDRRSSRSGF